MQTGSAMVLCSLAAAVTWFVGLPADGTASSHPRPHDLVSGGDRIQATENQGIEWPFFKVPEGKWFLLTDFFIAMRYGSGVPALVKRKNTEDSVVLGAGLLDRGNVARTPLAFEPGSTLRLWRSRGLQAIDLDFHFRGYLVDASEDARGMTRGPMAGVSRASSRRPRPGR